MAKKKGSVNLSASQKDEIRRLTQLANRRIKAATRAYEKAGKQVVPKELVGKEELQTKWGWNSAKNPLSRSISFNSEKEYRQHLRFLRSFEVQRPGIKEYTKVQRVKLITAIETTTGVTPDKNLLKKVNKMNVHDLSSFWNQFSKRAAKSGAQYSSGDEMDRALSELFGEDYNRLIS